MFVPTIRIIVLITTFLQTIITDLILYLEFIILSPFLQIIIF